MTGLRESGVDGRGAEEDEAEQRNGLIVMACRAATQDRDDNRRNHQPERDQNRRQEMRSGRREERRDHDEPDAENRERFPRAWLHDHDDLFYRDVMIPSRPPIGARCRRAWP
jgi:hypothetical protein